MNTVHPATYVAFKLRMADQPDREAFKRRRHALQAAAEQEMLDEYLPQGLVSKRAVPLMEFFRETTKT